MKLRSFLKYTLQPPTRLIYCSYHHFQKICVLTLEVKTQLSLQNPHESSSIHKLFQKRKCSEEESEHRVSEALVFLGTTTCTIAEEGTAISNRSGSGPAPALVPFQSGWHTPGFGISGQSCVWPRSAEWSRALWSCTKAAASSYTGAWAAARSLEAFHVGSLASHRCHF